MISPNNKILQRVENSANNGIRSLSNASIEFESPVRSRVDELTGSELKTLWPLAPEVLSLDATSVHVWAVPLQESDWGRQKWASLLSIDEKIRSSRFFFDRDRQRFITARGVLRSLLAKYLTVRPQELMFSYGNYGRPEVAEPVAGKPLRFNVSHSDNLALIAVTMNADIGIDIERIRPIQDRDMVARSFFTAHEAKMLRELPAEQRELGFFNCWTRKEAILKAFGNGISEDLNSFEVSLVPDAPPRIIVVPRSTIIKEEWQLTELRPAVGFVAALAVRRPEIQLKTWSWDNDNQRVSNFS